MIKIWLIGFIVYIFGIACLKIRVENELRKNPDFLMDLFDKNEDSLGNCAPYFCAIFPGLNLIVGIALIFGSVDNMAWETLKDKILDKN